MVNSTHRNFTIPPTSKLFVTVNTTKGAFYPMMNGRLIFRYYTVPTNCPLYNHWDGYKCVLDMGEYCDSLTPQY